MLHRGLILLTMPQSMQLSDLINPLLECCKVEKIISAEDHVVKVAGEIDDQGRSTYLAKIIVIN